MTHTKQLDPKTWMSVTFFAIVVTLTGMIAANVPFFHDDLTCANTWGCVDHTICPEKDFNPIHYALEHREHVNGRFGDMFTPLFVLIPRWIYGILYAIGYILIIYLMMKLTNVSLKQNSIKTIWLVISTVIAFPWFDLFYTRAVFFNYYPSAIFALAAIILFISPQKLQGWRLVGSIIICLLAGCWHELVATILLPGAILYCVITKSITRNQIIVAIAVSLGMFSVMTAPSFFNRVDQLNDLEISDWQENVNFVYISLLTFIAIISLITAYLRRVSLKDKAQTWALSITIVPSAIITMTSLFEPRICFLSSILIISSFFRVTPNNLTGRLIRILTTMAVLATIVHLTWVAADMIKVRRVADNLLAQAKEKSQQPIYCDLVPISHTNKKGLYKIIGTSYICNIIYNKDFANYTHNSSIRNIIPPALKDCDIKQAGILDANKRVYLYKGYILIEPPSDSAKHPCGYVTVVFNDGKEQKYNYIGQYFTDVHGTPLIYLMCYYPEKHDATPVAIKDLSY